MKIVKTDKYQNPKTDSCLFWIQTNVCQQEKLIGQTIVVYIYSNYLIADDPIEEGMASSQRHFNWFENQWQSINIPPIPVTKLKAA